MGKDEFIGSLVKFGVMCFEPVCAKNDIMCA